jgi:hypothetical protein
MKPKLPMTELTELEKALYRRVQTARFPPATASKSFMQGDADLIRWSDRGRAFMAFIAHRFRRQYTLTEAEWEWVNQWKRDA